jgi:hypothetical protein
MAKKIISLYASISIPAPDRAQILLSCRPFATATSPSTSVVPKLS